MSTTRTTVTDTTTTARRGRVARALAGLVVAGSLAAVAVPTAGADTNASHLNFAKCSVVVPVAQIRHTSGGGYWAETKLSCNVTFKFRLSVKEGGVEIPELTQTFGRFGANSIQTAASRAIKVVPGEAYQVVVSVSDGNGKSLGYMTSDPQVLNKPTRSNLARYLLSSPQVTLNGGYVAADLNAAAANKAGSSGALLSVKLLSVLTKLSLKHSFMITALESGGGGHSGGSLHYSGDAVDFGRFDGNYASGRDAGSVAAINLMKGLLPSGSGFGQSQCGATPNLPAGITTFPDACNHLHVQVPRGTA